MRWALVRAAARSLVGVPTTGGLLGNAWVDRQLAFWSPAWVLGGCALAVVLAVATRRAVAARTGLGEVAAALYVAVAGAVLAWTVSPRSPGDHYYDFAATRPRCVVWRTDLLVALTTPEWQVNLALLAPLGVIAALAPDTRHRRRLLASAALLPILIELAQLTVGSLNRVCEGTDVVTNWVGLLGGYAVGRAATAALGRRAGASPAGDAAPASRPAVEEPAVDEPAVEEPAVSAAPARRRPRRP